jgi:hypothetical protein
VKKEVNNTAKKVVNNKAKKEVNIQAKKEVNNKVKKVVNNKARKEVVSHPRCEHFYRLLYSSRDTEKGGRKGKRHRIDKQNEVSSCAAWGYLVPHGLR